MATQSLVRDLVIQRANAAGSHLDPVQWSDNLQLSINNGTQLTILDPKLPFFDKELVKEIDGVKLLDPRALFSINHILHAEVVGSLPIRRFNNVTVETLDEPFHLRYLNEPMITSYKWTSLDPRSRNNCLVVLFNTGEIILLQRESVFTDKYSVMCAVADHLILDLQLNAQEKANEVTAASTLDYLSLKIACFDIHKDENETLYLSLITNSGILVIYEIVPRHQTLKLITTYSTGITNVIKLRCSPWIKKKSNIALVLSDNSIQLASVSQNQVSSPREISSRTRFLHGQSEWYFTDAPILVSTFTGMVSVSKIGNNPLSADYNVGSFVNVASIVGNIQNNNNNIDLLLSFEDGNFDSLVIDSNTLQITKSTIHRTLNEYVRKSLYSFQLENSAAEDDDKGDGDDSTPSTSNGVASSVGGAKYLSQVIEGSFVNCGTKLSSSGILAVVFKILPKNMLYYETTVKSVLRVALINLPEFATDNNSVTSVASLNNLWFKSLTNIPVVPERCTLEAYRKFVSLAESFKASTFPKIEDIKFDASIKGSDLSTYILHGLHRNQRVKQLQILINYNSILINAIKNSEFSLDEELSTLTKSLANESSEIKSVLEKLVIKIIFKFISDSQFPLSNSIDKFVVIKYIQKINQNNPGFEVPQHAEITIETKFFRELFTASLQDMDVDQNMVESTSNHKWTQCQLTNLPLLQLHSRKDELNIYNYILEDKNLMEDESMTSLLLQNVQYCYVTGNKAYSS